jgi:predicted outer membrane protein
VRPPVPRFVRWVLTLSVFTALTVAVFQYWGTSQYGIITVEGNGQQNTSDTGQDNGWAQTQWGPLGPADRDLLIMIRQAGLCGGSSVQQALQRGGSAQVRTVAKRIGADYGDLGNQVRSVAGKLGVPLPNQPTAQQQGWMNELFTRSGPDFDRMFAQRLRVTDGEVLPAITSVRASTRNELIRSFAANAAVLVNQHMEDLERTGLVDYSRLSEAPPAATSPAAAAVLPAGREQHIDQVVNATQVPPAGRLGVNDTTALVAALVLVAALLLGLGMLGTTTQRVPSPPQRRRHAAQRW